jgi:hypothetical protein
MSMRLLFGALAAGCLYHAAAATAGSDHPAPAIEPRSTAHQIIAFDDIAPPALALKQCWNAMGMDSRGRVYIGFTSQRRDGKEDFAVFRYDPATADRAFLGSFMEASRAAGNLDPDEEIPKGHTRMVEIGGRIYMGSQGFHDLKAEIETLPHYRGAHLYAVDSTGDSTSAGTNDRLEDVGRRLPGGVLTRHQGIIALTAVPGRDLLLGLTHPHSDILLMDPRRLEATRLLPGIPWTLGNPLSREIVATAQGKVYTYRGTEDASHRDAVHGIWVHDLDTGAMAPTGYTATGGFWNGQTATRDGRVIYLSTVNGELYRLDTDTGAFTPLGPFLPGRDREAGRHVNTLYGITLSRDETAIYGIPGVEGAALPRLLRYDIASGAVAEIEQLAPGTYTGSDLRDKQGRLYFARFGNAADWDGHGRLVVLDVPQP